jgi:hypothetical protein
MARTEVAVKQTTQKLTVLFTGGTVAKFSANRRSV